MRSRALCTLRLPSSRPSGAESPGLTARAQLPRLPVTGVLQDCNKLPCSQVAAAATSGFMWVKTLVRESMFPGLCALEQD